MGTRIQSRARRPSTYDVRQPSMMVARSEGRSLKAVRTMSTQNMVEQGVLEPKQNEGGFLPCQAGTHGFSCNVAQGKRPTEDLS